MWRVWRVAATILIEFLSPHTADLEIPFRSHEAVLHIDPEILISTIALGPLQLVPYLTYLEDILIVHAKSFHRYRVTCKFLASHVAWRSGSNRLRLPNLVTRLCHHKPLTATLDTALFYESVHGLIASTVPSRLSLA